MTGPSPRVLHTSALLSLFAGQRRVMLLLDEAESAGYHLVMPTMAIAGAEAALGAGLRLWEHFLRLPSVRSMDLAEYTAIETGRIAAPDLRAGKAEAGGESPDRRRG